MPALVDDGDATADQISERLDHRLEIRALQDSRGQAQVDLVCAFQDRPLTPELVVHDAQLGDRLLACLHQHAKAQGERCLRGERLDRRQLRPWELARLRGVSVEHPDHLSLNEKGHPDSYW